MLVYQRVSGKNDQNMVNIILSPISHEYHDRNYMEWYPHEVLSIEAPEMHSTYHHMTCNEYPKVKTKTIPKVRKIYTYIYDIIYI